MAKKVIGQIKLQLPGGQATPAPPVGPALGQYGINLAGFCKDFNARTRGSEGLIIPAVIKTTGIILFLATVWRPLQLSVAICYIIFQFARCP